MRYLGDLDRRSADRGVRLLWVAGNHADHGALTASRVDADGTHRITPPAARERLDLDGQRNVTVWDSTATGRVPIGTWRSSTAGH
ncbi:hypothetical protein [Tsukamurella soli]|uniref:Uncharacterized protein n=1 Tax=Tsukamurella soli TaxID=644556 RepID=A0ABP8J6A8_9ACTN